MQTIQLQPDIEQRLATADAELLACERVGSDRLRLFIDHPDGVSLAMCERVTDHLRDLLIDYSLEVSSPGPQRVLTSRITSDASGHRARRLREPRDGHKSFTGELVGASDEVTVAADGVVSIPYSEINRSNLLEGEDDKEIVEAVGVLEREKGISADRLMAALEDALPRPTRRRRGGQVRARRGRPRQRRLPRVRADPAARPRGAAARRGRGGGRRADRRPETGELVYPEPPEIDQERLMQYRDQIDERDVTPDDFGRIAAQTAKQVILQRIREAERDNVFDEYEDRWAS